MGVNAASRATVPGLVVLRIGSFGGGGGGGGGGSLSAEPIEVAKVDTSLFLRADGTYDGSVTP